jgi:hypothetical protein
MAAAQSGYYFDVIEWRSLIEIERLGYVAGTLDTVTFMANFIPSDRPDMSTLAAAIQRCRTRAHLRTLGDVGTFAERALAQVGSARVEAAGTILGILSGCGK